MNARTRTIAAMVALFLAFLMAGPGSRARAQQNPFGPWQNWVCIQDPVSGANVTIGPSPNHFDTDIYFKAPGSAAFYMRSWQFTVVNYVVTLDAVSSTAVQFSAHIVANLMTASATAQIVYLGTSYSITDLDTSDSPCVNLPSPPILDGGCDPATCMPPGTGTPPPPPPPAALSVTVSGGPTQGVAPLSCSFTAVANKTGATFLWRDNGVQFATGAATSLTFASPSTHTISVTATLAAESASGSITVNATAPPPKGGGGNNGTGKGK